MVWNSFFVRAVYPPIFPQYQVNFPCRTLPQLLPGQDFYRPAPALAEKVVFKSYQFLLTLRWSRKYAKLLHQPHCVPVIPGFDDLRPQPPRK